MTPLPNCWVNSSSIISLDVHRKPYLENRVTQVRMDASKSPGSTSCLKARLTTIPDWASQVFVQSVLETPQGWRKTTAQPPWATCFEAWLFSWWKFSLISSLTFLFWLKPVVSHSAKCSCQAPGSIFLVTALLGVPQSHLRSRPSKPSSLSLSSHNIQKARPPLPDSPATITPDARRTPRAGRTRTPAPTHVSKPRVPLRGLPRGAAPAARPALGRPPHPAGGRGVTGPAATCRRLGGAPLLRSCTRR